MPDPSTPRDPSARQSQREEHITSSGFRIVGRGARDLVSRLNAPATPAPGRDEDVLYAARFDVRPRLGAASPVNAILTALGATIVREASNAPPLTRTRAVSLAAARFAGLAWDVSGDPGAWAGELLWRHKHPVVSGAPCTTHVRLVEQGQRVALYVRVTADEGLASVHGFAGAAQARPPFLTELHRSLRLTADDWDGEPRRLGDPDIDGFVRDVLLAESREYPVVLLTPLAEQGYLVAPDALADELLGIAPLYVIDRHATTFRLSDTLGDRRLSAYWGAMRVYMPGFSCADSPDEHPLLMRDRLIDPVMRAELAGRLARRTATRISMPPRVSAPPAEPTQPSQPTHPTHPTHPTPPLPFDPAPVLQALSRLHESVLAMSDELARLRTTTAVRSANTTSLERRINRLEDLLERALGTAPPAPPPVQPVATAETGEGNGGFALVDAVREAAAAHSDTLLVLESAERSAEESPYEDIERVAVILDAMANIAGRRQEGSLGMSLREAFRELGIDYRGGIAAATPERLRQQYRATGPDGRTYECEEHIALGGTYDPRRCLRIYFTSRAPLEARFVIGHVGRHLEVLSTT